MLLATPEYNHSIPGQLKNALDWLSRPLADRPLRNKPAAVVGASTGLFGAVWAQAEARKVLSAIGARVIDRELPVAMADDAFTPDGGLADADQRSRSRASSPSWPAKSGLCQCQWLRERRQRLGLEDAYRPGGSSSHNRSVVLRAALAARRRLRRVAPGGASSAPARVAARSPSHAGRSRSNSVTAVASRGRRSGVRSRSRARRSDPVDVVGGGVRRLGRVHLRTRRPAAISAPAASIAPKIPHWMPIVAPAPWMSGLSNSR